LAFSSGEENTEQTSESTKKSFRFFQNINKPICNIFNMKRGRTKNKKGQFYLIAAIIIITIILGFVAISNYSKKKSAIKIYDLGEELGIESENVLDFGTYNEYNETEMETLLNDFIEIYATYIEEGIEIYFIFGNFEKITVIGYQELEDVPFMDVYTDPGKEVIVTINSVEYKFKLKPGENFYFIISQEIGEEEHIITG